MQSSEVPTKFPIAFASSALPAYIQAVPQTYNSAIPGSFGLDVGSPPETFQDPSVGGIAPLGEYFNGLMNQTTACLRWIQAGGVFKRDAAFQAAIGGYPLGAILKAASFSAFWISTAENNVVNPDTGTLTAPATGWAVLQPGTYPWGQITGAPTFTLEAEFTGGNHSLATNGYQKFPGGLMLQWCETPLSSVSDQISTITYPTPFPGSPGVVFAPTISVIDATLTAGSASNQIIGGIQSYGLSSCNVILGQNGGGARNITVKLKVEGRWV
jgi:hypothetical protein